MKQQTKTNIKKVILCHLLIMAPVMFCLALPMINTPNGIKSYDLSYDDVFMFDILYSATLYVVLLIVRPIYGLLVTILSWKWKYILSLMFAPIVLNADVWSKIPRFISVPLGILLYIICLLIPIFVGFEAILMNA